MNQRLIQQLAFIHEIDKVKTIIRKTKNLSNGRHENDAEHSWHIAMMTMVLAEHANHPIDVLKVLKMQLIHDLVEIDAGDVIVYNKSAENEEAERLAAERIFGMLPDDQKEELLELWLEFEERKTPEARFAAALDRMEPVLQNIFRECETWNEHAISHSRVVGINTKIGEGSQTLWEYIKKELDRCLDEGCFTTMEKE